MAPPRIALEVIVAPPSPTVLALDCGTQSLRAGVFNRDGDLLGLGRVPAKPGLAVTTDRTWAAAVSAVREALEAAGGARPEAVAVTGQRASLVPCGPDGAYGRVLAWNEPGTAEQVPPLPSWLRAWARLSGAHELLEALQQRAPVNRLRCDNPGTWSATRRYRMLPGWLAHRMTGEDTDCSAAQVGYLPFDHRRGRWHGPRHWKWRALSMRSEQVPQLAPPGQALGSLTPEVAGELGLPAGTPVIACGTDKGCEVLAAGVLQPGPAVLSLGSAATVSVHLDQFSNVQRYRPAYVAASGAGWHAEVQLDHGLRLVSAFLAEVAASDPEAAWSLAALDGQLAERAPALDDPVFLPFLRPNLTHPVSHRAEGWLGNPAGIADRYAGIVSGVFFALRAGLDHLEQRFGSAGPMVACGGGARSKALLRWGAACLGRPLVQPRQPESSLLGAAMTAAVGAGWYPGFAEAAQAMRGGFDVIRPARESVPDQERAYRDRFLRALERG